MKNELSIIQPNAITQARYRFSEDEMKVLIYFIKDIQKLMTKDGFEFQQNLFGEKNHVIWLNVRDIDNNDPKRIKKALKDLRHRDFEIETDEFWLNVGFINFAQWNKLANKWEVEISRKLMPYMATIAQGYTEFELNAVLRLNSHSQRLYMMFSQFLDTGVFRINCDKLRFELGLEEKYSRYCDLKNRIIKSSIKEINDLFEFGKCDLKADLISDNKPRFGGDFDRILEFRIIGNRRKQLVDVDLKNQLYSYIMNVLKSIFKENQTLGNRIATFISGKHDLKKLANRLERLEEQAEEENKPLSAYAPLVVSIVQKDFGYK
ncbi:MAG: Plasmid replication initiation protein [Bacteroidota bacterium]|jgi:plasmid replication initiation protein